MLGSGALVVIPEGVDMVALAHNVVRFFRDESCGKCVPCRLGTEKLTAFLERALRGEGRGNGAARHARDMRGHEGHLHLRPRAGRADSLSLALRILRGGHRGETEMTAGLNNA